MLAAPPCAHLHAEAGCRALHLAHEPRLPDPGLAGDQDQLRLATPGVVEALLEPFALVVSIDERANARRLLPDHRNPQLARARGKGKASAARRRSDLAASTPGAPQLEDVLVREDGEPQRDIPAVGAPQDDAGAAVAPVRAGGVAIAAGLADALERRELGDEDLLEDPGDRVAVGVLLGRVRHDPPV